MTGILVAPDLDRVLIERRGIFTVPTEMASVACACVEKRPCRGIEVTKLPQEYHTFAAWAKEMGEMFIARQKPRGFEWAKGALWLHGPFPSYDFNQNLADIETSLIKDARRLDKNGDEHPELSLSLVFERQAFGPYVDYVFLGKFLMKDRMTDLEVL